MNTTSTTTPPGISRMELLRRTRGLSVRQVAEQLDYSPSWLAWVERKCGDSERISPRLRKALERFYGESFDGLITRVSAEPSNQQENRGTTCR